MQQEPQGSEAGLVVVVYIVLHRKKYRCYVLCRAAARWCLHTKRQPAARLRDRTGATLVQQGPHMTPT